MICINILSILNGKFWLSNMKVENRNCLDVKPFILLLPYIYIIGQYVKDNEIKSVYV